ncbi:Aspartate ammonia-lyase [Purpureocillium takamizusanense]|uniref:L-serine ammonia-lyase n=1 Tax=Purpureocillium takamizusanense TaxID=2060973 RepID=A0A9Q8QNC0_9HYPO|nr:Aspartate ammonia-lyase [Purpureocillium takamizusanense]UNI22316.1 Aspartate ammonia-lyase [Purpureocillium takamizusanense]
MTAGNGTRGMKIPWIETPLIKSASLSELVGCNVLLKLENVQPSGSFKSRGIGNFIVERLAAARAAAGDDPTLVAHFYSSSAGNAGLACVHAAVTLGCLATVVVPMSTTPFMIAKLRQAGASDVIQRGASWQEANAYLTETVMEDARRKGEAAVYVPPFDAPEIWDGHAHISRELARQIRGVTRHYPIATAAASRPSGNGGHEVHVTANGLNGGGHSATNGGEPVIDKIDAVVCSVGGGGLFCGIMQGLDETGMSATRVVAVETKGADALSQSLAAGQLVTLPAITSLATSLGARRVCDKAFEYARRETVSTAVLSDAEAIRACRRFADEEHILVELACGVCPAVCYNGMLRRLVPGLTRESVVVVVVCGGSNISFDIMEKYAASHLDGS